MKLTITALVALIAVIQREITITKCNMQQWTVSTQVLSANNQQSTIRKGNNNNNNNNNNIDHDDEDNDDDEPR